MRLILLKSKITAVGWKRRTSLWEPVRHICAKPRRFRWYQRGEKYCSTSWCSWPRARLCDRRVCARRSGRFVSPKVSVCDKKLFFEWKFSGDPNPLHLDPDFAAMAGFPVPILHGLCTYGYATRHIQNQFPEETIVGVKGRFSSPVLPGQTLITKMWKDGDKCLYEG